MHLDNVIYRYYLFAATVFDGETIRILIMTSETRLYSPHYRWLERNRGRHSTVRSECAHYDVDLLRGGDNLPFYTLWESIPNLVAMLGSHFSTISDRFHPPGSTVEMPPGSRFPWHFGVPLFSLHIIPTHTCKSVFRRRLPRVMDDGKVGERESSF